MEWSVYGPRMKNKGIQAWQMIAGNLRVQAQNDSGGLRAITILPGLSCRSWKGHSLGRWVKSVWGITRRTEIEYPVYVKHCTDSKHRHNVDLWTNEGRARGRACEQCIKITPSRPQSREVSSTTLVLLLVRMQDAAFLASPSLNAEAIDLRNHWDRGMVSITAENGEDTKKFLCINFNCT